jgi:hypothetical protein
VVISEWEHHVLETGARLRFWHESLDASLGSSMYEPRVGRNRVWGRLFWPAPARETGLIFQAKRPALPAKQDKFPEAMQGV